MPGPSITLHKFPVNKQYRKLWISFVQTTRKWDPKPDTARICSAHFEEDNFENILIFKAGLASFLILKENAVPTVRDPSGSSGTGASQGISRRSSAVSRKREVMRVSFLYIYHQF